MSRQGTRDNLSVPTHPSNFLKSLGYAIFVITDCSRRILLVLAWITTLLSLVVLCAWFHYYSLHDASTLRLASMSEALAPVKQHTVASNANLMLQVMVSAVSSMWSLALSAGAREAQASRTKNQGFASRLWPRVKSNLYLPYWPEYRTTLIIRRSLFLDPPSSDVTLRNSIFLGCLTVVWCLCCTDHHYCKISIIAPPQMSVNLPHFWSTLLGSITAPLHLTRCSANLTVEPFTCKLMTEGLSQHHRLS